MDFAIPIAGNESCVDTVRALHQTIVALRTALEKSRNEILQLKSKSCPDNTVEDTIQHLSVENHVLRQKVVNIESTEKSKRYKPKKVKQKESKELRKQQNYKSISLSENTQRVTCKSLENISDLHLLKTKEDRNKNQLTKSKTICFSHVFEGDKQISTANSLYISSTKQQKSDEVAKQEDLFQPKLRLRKVSRSKSKERAVKPNLLFSEKVIADSVSASRRGSIVDFKSEVFPPPVEIDELKQFTECVEKSRRIIEDPHLHADEVLKTEKESAETRKGKSKSKPLVRKRKETFVKDDGVEHNFNSSKSTRRRSSILGEQIEKVLIEQSQLKNNQTEKLPLAEASDGNISSVPINNDNELINTVTQNKGSSNIENQLKVTNIESKQLKEGKCEYQEATGTNEEVKTEDSVDFDIKSIDIKTKEQQVIIKDEANVNKTETKEDITRENGINNEFNTAEVEHNDTNKKNNALDENNVFIGKNQDQNSSEKGSDETLTNSSSQKNVEISVKIYKGSKKPIEIDIQTKKKNCTHKKSSKRLKMNNKSQNTSFDYVEPSNQITSNEVRRHIDIATGNNLVTNMLQNDIEQEVDDIELIFTTDDTKETDFKEELVPIEMYTETQMLQCPLSDYDEKLSAETSDRELEDDVFNDNFENENQENCNFQSQSYDFRRENSQIYNSKSDNSINHEDRSLRSYYSYHDSSFENKSLEKDESFDRFEEKTRIIETDISKIGIQDVEYNLGRRNTCPNPLQYRPIMHREALGRGLGSRKCRPILAHSNVIRKESGAQTDISALPGSSWRSESSLGHKVKVGENFTTLPSKFPHPGSRLRLSDKTVESRRVLLSDIGFTSMVPELSRSADHLCPPVIRGPVVSSYGQFLRTTDLYSPAYTSQKFVWATTTPSEGSHSQSRYSSQYPLSSPPVPTRRCSAPVSPSKKTTVMKTTPSRVRFANGSLPELRGDWTATVDSGESTDSLVEEAEHFLRRSIDCLAPCKDICFRSENVRVTGVRRASAPEPARDNVPPPGWQPFLPRIPRDLHLDYWVKVISPEGRVRGGRVRYVGPLLNQPEAFVGVQLSTPDGHSDGTYNNRRYFNCEPYHGLFVLFKKIVMGWRP